MNEGMLLWKQYYDGYVKKHGLTFGKESMVKASSARKKAIAQHPNLTSVEVTNKLIKEF
jgi:hypothetical protein